jgi:hypothetical protein
MNYLLQLHLQPDLILRSDHAEIVNFNKSRPTLNCMYCAQIEFDVEE